ncbi:unnamed protein product [Polarella glacialis]|uniref:Uncharacterized protein n=1 Tax=Polarella glacialis TaxID=89957 RepID=A0A813I4K8_POLGL|nr:unnamed protein product [Polarella glacialis]
MERAWMAQLKPRSTHQRREKVDGSSLSSVHIIISIMSLHPKHNTKRPIEARRPKAGFALLFVRLRECNIASGAGRFLKKVEDETAAGQGVVDERCPGLVTQTLLLLTQFPTLAAGNEYLKYWLPISQLISRTLVGGI